MTSGRLPGSVGAAAQTPHSHPRTLDEAGDTLTDEESASVVARAPSLHGEPAYELEYIKGMIGIAQDDIRHIFLLAGAALAIGALFVTQIPIETVMRLRVEFRIGVVTGLACLGLAALSFFQYGRAMHLNRMRMVRCLPTLDVVRVRELWAGPHSGWARHKHLFHRGQWLMGAGVALEGIAILDLLVGT